jgi:hypothetical protein
MSMDVLNNAAKAAGYAMATPDEDCLVDQKWIGPSGEAAGRGIVPAGHVMHKRPGSIDSVLSFAGWMRSMMPSFGGRAPA